MDLSLNELCQKFRLDPERALVRLEIPGVFRGRSGNSKASAHGLVKRKTTGVLKCRQI